MEDGVDILVPGNLSSGEEKSLDNTNLASGTSIYSQSESNGTQSFTFETQVGYPSYFKDTYAQSF